MEAIDYLTWAIVVLSPSSSDQPASIGRLTEEKKQNEYISFVENMNRWIDRYIYRERLITYREYRGQNSANQRWVMEGLILSSVQNGQTWIQPTDTTIPCYHYNVMKISERRRNYNYDYDYDLNGFLGLSWWNREITWVGNYPLCRGGSYVAR